MLKKSKVQRDQKHNFKKALRNNWFILKISFQAAPLFMIMMIIEAVKQSGLIFLEHTYGIKFVLEAAEFGKPFIKVLHFLLFVFAAYAISFVISGFYQNLVSLKGLPKIQKKLKELLYEKVKDLDLECYDNPAYYNEFVLSIAEAENSINRTHRIYESFFYAVTTIITRGIFFLNTDPTSFLFVFLSFGLTFFFSNILNKVNYKNRLEKNVPERKRAYVHRVFYLNEYAKEVRLNPQITDRLYEEFDTTNNEIYRIEKAYAKKRISLHFIVNYITNDFISDVLYIIYLVFRAAVQKVISYSSVVVLAHTTGGLKSSLRDIARIFPQITENSLYIEKIQNFLHYETKIISTENLPLPKEPKALELRNVSFGYNEKDGYILDNVNLTINPYEKIALVGYNGAGKTTLIKLIMRLYDPSEGEILYDGVNIKHYQVEAYRAMIGTVFQDFKIFAASISENVTLDDEEQALYQKEEPSIVKSLEFSGFKERLGTLSKGLATPLTTEFEEDGVNLSGGESQKLAIARAFYKDANMIILDEPSSALDPIAEYQLNETMLEAAANKTVIFISHRLSTTRNADKILMLEHGKIIEEGKHEELLLQKGKYATMWKAQAGRYVEM